MSWMAKLYQTYEAVMESSLPEEQKPMPVCHTLQNAHIHIVIDGEGCFIRASVVEKTQIVLPASEKSAGRSSGEAPHPLADKIHYVAKDYASYGGKKKAYFTGYEQQLAEWCRSPYKNAKAVAVYNYIRQGSVVEDLVNAGILYLDEEGCLLEEWPDANKTPPPIFRVLPKKPGGSVEPGDALVCWSVEIPGESQSDTWSDPELHQSWINFDTHSGGMADFCFVSGKEMLPAVNHPAKLRHTGDKAKLVSANDSSGFTFRGRFTDDSGVQALGIGFEVTQKAHNALRWLIGRQGYRNGDQVFVTWAVSGREIPSPLKSAWELLMDDNLADSFESTKNVSMGIDHGADFGQYFALQFNHYLRGYRSSLKPNEQIVVLGLDSATPGRMGINYYRELLVSEFLDRIEKWHKEFAWPQRFTKEVADSNSTKKSRVRTFWPKCSPVPWAIAEAAYGNILKSNATLKKSVLERILPCIVDARPFPIDIMLAAVRRSSNRHNCEPWEWNRNLGVTCALFKGFYMRHSDSSKRREYAMSLEEGRVSRDYLYGRLLAIAEYIEEMALRVGDENRPTTATRLMQRFADRPFSTWRNIELGIQPYMQRLQNDHPGFLTNRKKELDSVAERFDCNDFTNDKPLSGEFLLGYHCQKQFWRQKRTEHPENLTSEGEES